jgi:hypothetical protein
VSTKWPTALADGFSRGSAFTSNSTLEGAVQDQPDGATHVGLEIERAAPQGLKGLVSPFQGSLGVGNCSHG